MTTFDARLIGSSARIATGTSTATTGSGTSTASGSTFLIGVVYWPTSSGGADPTTLTDSKLNVYSQLVDVKIVTTADAGVRWYACENGVGGASHTATVNFASTAGQANVVHVELTSSDITKYPTFDLSAVENATAATTFSTTTGTLATADEVLVSLGVVDAASYNGAGTTTSTNQTILDSSTPTATLWDHQLGKIVAAATTALSPNFTADSGGSPHATAMATVAFKAATASVTPALGYVKRPGPGVGPSRRDQFKPAARAVLNTAAVTTVTQSVGAYTWAGTTSTTATLTANYAAQRPIGPSLRFPFNPLQFAPDPRAQLAVVASATIVNGTPGTWSWAGTTSATSQLLNASAGTYSWAGTTSATTQLVNQIAGTWSWAGTTAGTTQLVNASVGAYSWAGLTASLDNGLNATPGAYTWAGTTAGTSQLINASAGLWSWAGTTANLGSSLDASIGTWSWAGTTAEIPTQITLLPGVWGWVGVDATIPGTGGAGDYPKKRRRFVTKIGNQLVVIPDPSYLALLEDDEKPEPVKVPIKAIKAKAKVYKQDTIVQDLLKQKEYDEALRLYEAMQDEEDIEMLLLSL